MELARKTQEGRLPMVTVESKTIGTKELQKISAKYLDQLAQSGPEIIVVGGVKKAVLVDYDQYLHFQKRFREVVGEAFAVTQFLPKFKVPQGYELRVERLQVELVGTLQKIVSESSDTSPFADLMDSIIGLAMGVFAESEPAPAEMKQNAHKKLTQTAEKVERVSARLKRNLTE
jgi:hypothetical protein